MTIRTPRGYGKNRPQYLEVCEGVRPTEVASPKTVYTGLPHVRVDEMAHDPIVLDPGTIVGYVSYTGAGSTLLNTLVPCVIPTGTGTAESAVKIKINGSAEAASTWSMPAGSSGDITSVGVVKPIGVIYQPIYSFILQTLFTNYTRQVNVGVVTDMVVMVPATNAEEAAIRAGDTVVVGSGDHYGIGWGSPYTYKMAGRYARYDSTWAFATERTVGRCLKKIRIATTTSSAGTQLSADLSTMTKTTEATAEFGHLDKVQTVPGLGLSGSETKGIPAYLLDARADDGTNHGDGTKSYWALVMLIRL